MKASVDDALLDKSVPACDDFYVHACGGWRKANAIPEEESSWSRFVVLRRKNEATLHGLVEKMASGEDKDDAYARQLGDFYTSCMDEIGIEAKGKGELTPELARIDGVTNATALAKELAHLHTLGVNAVFRVDSEQDAVDSTQVIGAISQGGLGMPDRDYYDDDKKKDVKAKYETFVETLFGLLGDTPAQAAAHRATVMKIESKLALASMSRTDRRDPHKVYNRIERKGLAKAAPQIPWDAYFTELGAPSLQAINVAQTGFITVAGSMVSDVPMADWRTYLKWHVVRDAAPALSAKFVDANFAFTQALTGAKVIEPRWKRCVRAIDGYMGEALGRAYVKVALGEEGKANVRHMVDLLQASMNRELDLVPWMDAATRTQAHEKLSFFQKKVGYPDAWRNYDALQIDRGSYFGNRIRSEQFEVKRVLAKVGQPVDRAEWEMSPPTVNAYYRKDLNEIVFPAGILQLPFYSSEMTRAMTYGAIGSVMGHEITHGFDDKGRLFDAHGNLRDWWTPSVNTEFNRRATCVEKEFDAFVPVDDIHVKGKLTLGENIADLGGLKIAITALHEAQKQQPSTDSYAYTEEQQFFYGFAQVWCENTRDERLRVLLATDPHSPARYRVNGSLSNMPEFAAAFGCDAGKPMARPAADRCEAW